MRWTKTLKVQPVLFTIGYEQHREPGSLVDALSAAGVERLVDVRELPMSRRRGFSKTRLREVLEAAGFSYEHQRALGNPKPYRDLYRSGEQARGARLYRAYLRNGSSMAVDELSESLLEHKTCVLCFERDHRTCHRDVIVQELTERIPALLVTHL
jgi:uncharacterized protein (DUF488 family)